VRHHQGHSSTDHHGHPVQPRAVGFPHPRGAGNAANANDPFVMAPRRIEFENGRLFQAQILFLKGPELAPFRGAVSSALKGVTLRLASSGRSKASALPSRARE
jgi:hypothetical protein